MKITSKGQVTIPIDIREKAGLWPETEIEFILDGKEVKIRKVKVNGRRSRGQSIVSQLKGKASVSLSTEQIMALTRGDE